MMDRRALLRAGGATIAGGAATLVPDSGTLDTEVKVVARCRVETADGTLLADAEASDTATLSVERASEYDASEYGSVGGSGGLTIELA